MKAIITLQELAVKLNGKFWSKEGKERVYLEEGFNTKKVSTSTYVEIVNGNFVVKCFVKCDSQSYQWCKSQADIVIENVTETIREILNPAIEIIEESAEEILKEEIFQKDCEDVYEQLSDEMDLFEKLTFLNGSVFFHWRKDIENTFNKTFFGVNSYQRHCYFTHIKIEDNLSKEDIKNKIVNMLTLFNKRVLEINEFKDKCKELVKEGYKICGDSLCHGQSQVMKDGKNVGHVHFTTIALK